MREVLWEFVNEGDLGFLEGNWSKMSEPPPKWGSVGNYVYVMCIPFHHGFNIYFIAQKIKIK